MRTLIVPVLAVAALFLSLPCQAADAQTPTQADLATQATAAIARAVHYLRTEVAVGGGYLGHYKADLSDQWGEGHATRDQNWIQPPGCPSVGFSFLHAWEGTDDPQYREAACEVARSLVSGQLECGGWDYIVDHSEQGARNWFYRRNRDSKDPALTKGRNRATLDDDTTQHAIRLLMAVDQMLDSEVARRQAREIAASIDRLEMCLVPQEYKRSARAWHDQGGKEVPWEKVLAASEIKFRGTDLGPKLPVLPLVTKGAWGLSFELKEDRKPAFRQFTKENVGRTVAMVLDGKCLMAPVIKSEIPGVGLLQPDRPAHFTEFFDDNHKAIHEAALYALDALLKAQDTKGGWSQRFPRAGTGYDNNYTFNDNTFGDCVDVMILAYNTYGDSRYRDAVVRAGDFILMTQLPEPHPVWAQQYDKDLKPSWARKFEPPAATAGESGGVLTALTKITLFTGDMKYLKPFPSAIAWYKRSELTGADKGLWARFYELGTNRPIYMTKDYKLTYDGSDTPTHYSFKGKFYPTAPITRYEEISAKGVAQYLSDHETRPLTASARAKRIAELEPKVTKILKGQDEKGRWIRENLVVMNDFERNLDTLSEYVGLVRSE